MPPIIEVRDLSKQYLLGEAAAMHGSLREALTRTLRRPWTKAPPASENGNGKGKRQSFWALRNVSLDVAKGDTVGIIGSNGAGKSTLLKILSRITDPSEGYVKIRGQVASLLEVGTGFHPELTGRENVYMNGAIMGMRKAQIDAAFDEILAFAGIGKFIDTPVKRYSSGMYVRLAFSVAANLQPEILIIDEVLAVGDVAFQKKCLGKMAEACSQSRTVLFVSHNLAAVEALCNRGVVLQHGLVVFSGSAKEAVQHYLNSLGDVSSAEQSHQVDLVSAPGRPGKYRPWLKRLELYTENGEPLTGSLPIGAPLTVKIYFHLEEPCKSVDAYIGFETLRGQRICTAFSGFEPDREHDERSGDQVFVCHISSLPLIAGEYKLTVGLHIGLDKVDLVEQAKHLAVHKTDYYGTGVLLAPDSGVFLLPNRWTLMGDSAQVGSPPAAVTAP
jgi:homopolymeric O-antigen transport system ATP-binding protein